jgi:hypothetical protein
VKLLVERGADVRLRNNNVQTARDMAWINPLSAELKFICHLLTLLGTHHILHVSRIRVNGKF